MGPDGRSFWAIRRVDSCLITSVAVSPADAHGGPVRRTQTDPVSTAFVGHVKGMRHHPSHTGTDTLIKGAFGGRPDFVPMHAHIMTYVTI